MIKKWIGTDAGNEGNWSTAANWSPSGVPVAADIVIIANSSQSITAGLNQSAVALTSLTIDASFTGLIGTTSADFLQVATSVLQIGQRRGNVGTFSGSKRLNINLGSSTACTATIYSTATSSQDTNRTPCRLLATNASTVIKVINGFVSIADDSETAATVDTVNVAGGVVTVGEQVTLENVITTGGVTNVQSPITVALTAKGGVINVYDGDSTTTIATATINDGSQFNYYASGTITALNLNGGTTDLTASNNSKTVTTLTVNENASLIIDTATTTLTNNIVLGSTRQFNLTFNRR